MFAIQLNWPLKSAETPLFSEYLNFHFKLHVRFEFLVVVVLDPIDMLFI